MSKNKKAIIIILMAVLTIAIGIGITYKLIEKSITNREDFKYTVDDKEYHLKEALLENKITMEEIIAKANQDEKDGKIKAEMYKDGGSMGYHYENYTIIKCHTSGGNRDVYIGTKEMTLNDVR